MSDPLIIQPGDLRNSITIQAQSQTKDEFGQAISSWTNALTTRARVRTLALREQFGQPGFSGQATLQVTMRYQSAVAILPGQRIVVDGKTLIVQSVENVRERNRIINVLAIELQPTQ
jgi:SPP1 family predicted phage head-tail adaptor